MEACENNEARQIKFESLIEYERSTSRHEEAEEPKDFSPSSSDWEPTDETPTTDDDEVKPKKPKLDWFSRFNENKRKTQKRNNSKEALANDVSKSRKRKIDLIKISNHDNNLHFSAKTSNSEISIDVNEIFVIKQYFHKVFDILKEQPKCPSSSTESSLENTPENPIIKPEINKILHGGYIEEDCSMSGGNGSNKLDKNVYKRYKANKAINEIINQKDGKWVKIGSGKTLIREAEFNNINWKSYTSATRTLLQAVFSRSVLATHSLTGRKSPAFQNKPAKKCLDPRKVTDIILEVTRRYKVKQNQVRSIITTKCADECKMLMMREQNEKSQTLPDDQEDNLKVEEDEAKEAIIIDEANKTC